MIDLLPNELIVDNFAGGGGASTGIEQALGRPVDIAINHDRKALALHAANHPDTRHLCEDVWHVDIVAACEGRPVGLAWFSPDCTYFSKARGAKPQRDKAKKVRGLAWVALKWAGLVRPRVIVIENVEEFQFWGPLDAEGMPCKRRRGTTFKRWMTQLRNLGYRVEFRDDIRACDYGAPTIRKRLFIVARCDGKPIVWPEKTHGRGLKPHRTAAECIDWTLPCPSIFLPKRAAKKLGIIRPLAPKSLARIAKGIRKYVLSKERKPFLVTLTHQGGDRVGDISSPLSTVTGAHRGEMALVQPFIGSYYGSNRPGGDRTRQVDEPLPTAPTENRFALVSTFLSRQFGKSVGSPSDSPVGVVTPGGGGKTAVVSAVLFGAGGSEYSGKPKPVDAPANTLTTENHTAIAAVHLAQHNSQRDGVNPGRSAASPMSTITGRGTQQQLVTSYVMKMRGTNVGHAMSEPLHTISADGTHHAEVRAFLQEYLGDGDGDFTVEVDGECYAIVDIGMRMLTPRELFNAQGFPPEYMIEGGRDVCSDQGAFLAIGGEWIKLTKTEQIRMCGNSVSPYPARAIVEAQFLSPAMEAAA